jgi:hypothetical protein
MVRKTVIALCSAAVLATAFVSTANAARYDEQWWEHAYQQHLAGKGHCVSGDSSTTSAYPSWMRC